MAFYLDSGLYRLTVRKPADASQAPFVLGDNAQPFKYYDLTEFSKRLAPAQLAYLNSAVLFFEIYKTGWRAKSASLLTLLQACYSLSLILTIFSRY
jgi:hypothetical protein